MRRNNANQRLGCAARVQRLYHKDNCWKRNEEARSPIIDTTVLFLSGSNGRYAFCFGSSNRLGCSAMTSTFVAAAGPSRGRKQCLQSPTCVLRGSVCVPPAQVRRGEPQTCCCQGSEESRKTDARVQQVRTYDEAQGRVYSTQREPVEDEDGSIAALVPGGLISQRSRKGGAAAAEARRERSKPLKINTDLKLVRFFVLHGVYMLQTATYPLSCSSFFCALGSPQ